MGISILAWLSSRDTQYGSRDDNQANMEMANMGLDMEMIL